MTDPCGPWTCPFPEPAVAPRGSHWTCPDCDTTYRMTGRRHGIALTQLPSGAWVLASPWRDQAAADPIPAFQCAQVVAEDLGDTVRIEAGDYINPLAELDADGATELRDWLTTWLDAR